MQPTSANDRLSSPDASSPAYRPASESSLRLRSFLTTVMCILSLLVLGLGLEERNTLWLWVGFICALVSGVFFQVLINRRKAMENADFRRQRGGMMFPELDRFCY